MTRRTSRLASALVEIGAVLAMATLLLQVGRVDADARSAYRDSMDRQYDRAGDLVAPLEFGTPSVDTRTVCVQGLNDFASAAYE